MNASANGSLVCARIARKSRHSSLIALSSRYLTSPTAFGNPTRLETPTVLA
jgi:hypothetical protein